MACHHLVVLAYLGPETFIPLVSVVAGVVGIVLAFGKEVWATTAALFSRLGRLFLRK